MTAPKPGELVPARRCVKCCEWKELRWYQGRARTCALCVNEAANEPSHEEWQRQVVDLARALGWRFLHVRRTQGFRRGEKHAHTTATNIKGWPDLFLWHPRRGGFVGLELKVGGDVASPEQLAVLAELKASGALTGVVYPRDLPIVKMMLTAGRGRLPA